jgi:hypothetical protein
MFLTFKKYNCILVTCVTEFLHDIRVEITIVYKWRNTTNVSQSF